VVDIDHDPVQQNLLRSLVRFARMSSMRLVAEGIERFDELAMLVRLGVHYGQGYYLAVPAAARCDLEPDVRQAILSLLARSDAEHTADPAVPPIQCLVQPVVVVDRTTPAIEVAGALDRPDHPGAAALLDGRRFLGLVYRQSVLDFCRRTSGRAPVDSLEVRPGCPIGEDITLAEALELAASRPEDQIADPFSRVQADRWVTARIRSGDPANIAFVDLRGFEAFNAAYGFDAGDAMLLRLVGLIRATSPDRCAPWSASSRTRAASSSRRASWPTERSAISRPTAPRSGRR
jgi:hypothetical protein